MIRVVYKAHLFLPVQYYTKDDPEVSLLLDFCVQKYPYDLLCVDKPKKIWKIVVYLTK